MDMEIKLWLLKIQDVIKGPIGLGFHMIDDARGSCFALAMHEYHEPILTAGQGRTRLGGSSPSLPLHRLHATI